MDFSVGSAHQSRQNVVLGLHIFRNLAEKNMAAVSISKSGPIICVNSQSAETE